LSFSAAADHIVFTTFAIGSTRSCVAVSEGTIYLRFIRGGMFAAHSNGVYMIRIMILGLAVAGMALPAYAETASVNNAATAASTDMTSAANAQQARVQLAHQGYTGISPLHRDDQGRWAGTAMRDGKTVYVAVAFPAAPAATAD
jgi:hypothetical protein